MKRTIIASLVLLFVFGLCGANRTSAFQNGNQQSETRPQLTEVRKAATAKPTPNNPPATLRREFGNSFPIPTGEKLEYEIKFSRFPIYASVGVITFENLGAVSKPQNSAEQNAQEKKPEPLIKGMNVEFAPAPEEQLLHLRATAVSKGMLLAMLGVDVRDRFETLVDLRDFSAVVSFKEMKEGKKNAVQTALFDRAEQQVKYLTTDLNKPAAPPRAKLLPRKEGMLGLLSAIYFVRLQKLKEGQMLVFPVSTDEENYQFEVLVGKRESLKTDCGKIKTIRLEPKLFGPGRLITRKGEMTMWVSDDNKHTPLRLVAKTASGTVTAKLLNFKNKCNIIEPEDEEKPKTEKAQKGE
ncbi:MAG: DUF3108 domain-containing protein [Blastocatellales bacterium]